MTTLDPTLKPPGQPEGSVSAAAATQQPSLANGPQPVSGQDLARGLLRALFGRNREQLGGLQWANLRDGLKQAGVELTPEADQVLDTYGQLAKELLLRYETLPFKLRPDIQLGRLD